MVKVRPNPEQHHAAVEIHTGRRGRSHLELLGLLEEELAADTEVDARLAEDAHVLGEHVVAVDADLGEVANLVELEEDLDGFVVEGVVAPADPLVALDAHVLAVEPEVGVALHSVRQLSWWMKQIYVSFKSR